MSLKVVGENQTDMNTDTIQIKPVFVKTKNVRNFETVMNSLSLEDEGRLAMIYGQAGRGKSRTAHWYNASHNTVYIYAMTVWHNSPLEFLRALCTEIGHEPLPGRAAAAQNIFMEYLRKEKPAAVFIDEIEKLSKRFLDIVREMSGKTGVPFVLIGERELVAAMKINRRVWSRTSEHMEFEGIQLSDAYVYAAEATGLEISTEIATELHKSSEGDFRLLKRSVKNAVKIANAKGKKQITAEMVREAASFGLKGK
ncbi:MAG: ATP-binding protein [Desulfobacteraceae bacterium]|nr:ATP-binding protein [Desulfobacteraceae bacterium]